MARTHIVKENNFLNDRVPKKYKKLFLGGFVLYIVSKK
jgi:hypothetical protein